MNDAVATRKQILEMGDHHEPEPGVLIVVTTMGTRLRWLRIFRSDLWRLVGE